MSLNLEKLKQDLQKNSKKSNMESFENILVAYLGVEPREFFAKLKDENGNTIKDESGKAKRSAVINGYTYTFSELTTSKIVKVVFNKKYNLELLGVYIVSGDGYDIKQSNMLFLQENCKVNKYE